MTLEHPLAKFWFATAGRSFQPLWQKPAPYVALLPSASSIGFRETV
jgi:hypothetical protein